MSTELLKDQSVASRYITLDRWVSKDAHDDFLIEFDTEHGEMMKSSEGLAEKETHMGSFQRMR